jgi:hypothetical protein
MKRNSCWQRTVAELFDCENARFCSVLDGPGCGEPAHPEQVQGGHPVLPPARDTRLPRRLRLGPQARGSSLAPGTQPGFDSIGGIYWGRRICRC